MIRARAWEFESQLGAQTQRELPVEASGRYPLESRPIMLALSFVEFDLEQKCGLTSLKGSSNLHLSNQYAFPQVALVDETSHLG